METVYEGYENMKIIIFTSNSKKDICRSNQLDFVRLFFMDCKPVILRKANIVKISLKKCNPFFPYFVHGRLHNCRLKTWSRPSGFPPDCEKGHK